MHAHRYFLAALLAGLTARAAVAQSIHGIVASDDSAGVADAEVSLLRDGAVVAIAKTAGFGRFDFYNVESGSYLLSARRLGYRPSTVVVHLDRQQNLAGVRILVAVVPAELSHQVVTEHAEGRLRDFYERRSKTGFAKFIDRAEIEKRNPVFLSEMFRRIPGASIRGGRGFGNIVRIRGCQPTLWIDGKRLRNVELDEVTDPDAVAGIEVYNSPAGVPVEFTDPVTSMCGVILVWTRSQ